MAQLTAKDILGTGLAAELDSLFSLMKIAEDEITRAMRRYPHAKDLIWHSFILLTPTLTLTRRTEVFASHCREILGRVARGQDTRPGTAVECVAALSDTSTVAPLTTAGAGLYCRMWEAAGLPHVTDQLDRRAYESIASSTIDDHECVLRAELAVPDRKLPNPIKHNAYCPSGESQSLQAAA